MPKKYIVLKTGSSEKLEEIKPHFTKYNIDCTTELISDRLPIAVLTEQSVMNKNKDESSCVISYLTVEMVETIGTVTKLVMKHVYIAQAHGILSMCEPVCEPVSDESEGIYEPKPWGWDAQFIPDGLMTSYYDLKKRGLKISPRDVNIGLFLQDFVYYKSNSWTFKELQVSRPVDLEVDYKKVLFDFFDFEPQKDFIGYEFWETVVNSAVSGGVFIRKSNTRKMNNYWWPVGNAGLPITSKPNDPMHEKTYMMHDVFHYLVPDLLYSGNVKSQKYYEWSYTLHRVMTECFTLVLGDMFYVHYLFINKLNYETVEKRRIYPIFKAIYGKRTDVFTMEILEEVIRASVLYGLRGDEAGFVALFVKYNTLHTPHTPHTSQSLEDFKTLLKSFREKYDYYIIQDLKWTIFNASRMKEHSKKYQYLNFMESITTRLDIVTLDSLELETSTGDKQGIDYFVSVGLEQFKKALKRPICSDKDTLKNKFLRWSLGQLCFFEHYNGIPIVDGYRKKFYDLTYEIFSECGNFQVLLNKIRNFRYQWEYLMNSCVKMQIVTQEEANQYKEVFPVFDPHYIDSYEMTSDNHSEIMLNFIRS